MPNHDSRELAIRHDRDRTKGMDRMGKETVIPGTGPSKTGAARAYFIDMVAMSINQFLGCTTPPTLAEMARGPTSCATQRKAA